MVSNLAENIKSVLTNFNIRDIHGWTDSSCTTLAQGKRGLSVICVKRNQQNQCEGIYYLETCTKQPKPSRHRKQRVYGNQIPELWWTVPTWLQQPEQWPPQPNIMLSDESEKEAKAIKTLLTTSITIDHE